MTLTQKLKRKFFRHIGLWPPLFGAGIKVTKMQDDLKYLQVAMNLRFWNANYVGTHYGGSLYSMTDPFYMLMLMENLGRDYIVWDKSACIDFIRPGKGKVYADFILTDEKLNEIKNYVQQNEKGLFDFEIEIKDNDNNIICKVTKTLYVRTKSSLRKKHKSKDKTH